VKPHCNSVHYIGVMLNNASNYQTNIDAFVSRKVVNFCTWKWCAA